jgi:putative ABC transport system permease protein
MSIRTTKILRDLWVNKARSLLIVLAVTGGVAAFGLMISGSIVLEQNLKDAYAATNPAHTVLTLSAFDDALVSKVRGLTYVQDAQARRLTRARLETEPGKWLSLDLATVSDFQAISLNR